MGDWDALNNELSAWGDGGNTVEFWWRDDDAVDRTVALDRLLSLSKQATTPLALAVIPDLVAQELVSLLCETGDNVQILQHGFRHENHAAANDKKSEFPEHRLHPEMLGDVAIGWEGLRMHLPNKALPVFVPPWNRIAADFIPRLSNGNMRGLSAFGPRGSAAPAPGLVQINTHIDIVAWRQNREFIGEADALQACVVQLQTRRAGMQDDSEALGLLTHHLVMDEACWSFCEKLMALVHRHPAASWQRADQMFGLAS